MRRTLTAMVDVNTSPDGTFVVHPHGVPMRRIRSVLLMVSAGSWPTSGELALRGGAGRAALINAAPKAANPLGNVGINRLTGAGSRHVAIRNGRTCALPVAAP